MGTCYDLKGDHSKRVDTGSCKTDQWGFDGLQLILANFHLLEGRQIYDVCRATIVNQNTSGGIASDLHCDNQCVVMGVEDFAGVFFCKCNRKVFQPRFLVTFLCDQHIVYLASVPNHHQNPNKRNSLQAHLRHRGCYSRWNWTNHPKDDLPQRRGKWRAASFEPWSPGWNKGKGSTKNRTLPRKNDQIL